MKPYMVFFIMLAGSQSVFAQIQTPLQVEQAREKLFDLKAQKAVKNEFETSQEFAARKTKLLAERHDQVEALIDQTYPGNVRVGIGTYNADREIFPIGLDLMGFKETLVAYVPRLEAKFVRENASQARVTGKFWLEIDGTIFPVGKLRLEVTGKSFYTSPGSTKIAVVKERYLGSNQAHYSVAFSPDGKWLATAGADGINLWDTGSGDKTRTFGPIEGLPKFITFSPDGQWLGSILFHDSWETSKISATLKIWEVNSGRGLAESSLGTGWGAYAIAFSPFDKWIAIGVGKWEAAWEAFSGKSAKQGYLKIIDLIRSQEVADFPCTPGKEGVCDVAFSPNGKWLASGEYGRQIRVWDIATKQMVQRFKLDGEGGTVVTFSPQENWLCSYDAGGLKLWDVVTGQEIKKVEGSSAIDFSPDGRWVASPCCIADLASGETLRELNYPANGIAFMPDGQWLALPHARGTTVLRIKEMK